MFRRSPSPRLLPAFPLISAPSFRSAFRSAASLPVLFAGLVLGLAGCDDLGGARSAVAERDVLPGGVERVRYGSLPASDPEPLAADLWIGSLDGEGPDVFGDVRSVEVGVDGRIFVLDGQAVEIRAFNPDGSFRGLVTRRGEGPGETVGATGMVRAPEGTLWVQDPRRWLTLQLSPEGDELGRIPMFVSQWGFVWDGTVDDRGRIWTAVSHRVEPRTGPPEPGFSQNAFRRYQVWHDPGTGAGDSVLVGIHDTRSYAVTLEGGWGFRVIPYEPGLVTAVGPDGGVWAAGTDAYRIVRIDERGDTILVIEVDQDPEPVTEDDRRRFLEEAAERGPDEVRIARDIARSLSPVKPVLSRIAVDDRGNLWVRRHAETDDEPHFDVFDFTGEYLGALRLGFRVPTHFTPRLRDGLLLTPALDALDVPSVAVVQGPLPGG